VVRLQASTTLEQSPVPVAEAYQVVPLAPAVTGASIPASPTEQKLRTRTVLSTTLRERFESSLRMFRGRPGWRTGLAGVLTMTLLSDCWLKGWVHPPFSEVKDS
jgi:hypothetical protein